MNPDYEFDIGAVVTDLNGKHAFTIVGYKNVYRDIAGQEEAFLHERLLIAKQYEAISHETPNTTITLNTDYVKVCDDLKQILFSLENFKTLHDRVAAMKAKATNG